MIDEGFLGNKISCPIALVNLLRDISDFLGKLGLKLALGLVTSFTGRKGSVRRVA